MAYFELVKTLGFNILYSEAGTRMLSFLSKVEERRRHTNYLTSLHVATGSSSDRSVRSVTWERVPDVK
jgi:hypothetical protein